MNTTYRVSEGIYRGPRPTEPTGFRTVLCIESKKTNHGSFFFLHHPINSFGFPPSKINLEGLSNLLTKKYLYPIFIHCKHGKDRTGMVIAYYRVKKEGWTVRAALDEMKRYGFHMWKYWWWIPYFKLITKK